MQEVFKFFGELWNLIVKLFKFRKTLSIIALVVLGVFLIEKLLSSLEHICSIFKGGNKDD